MPNASPTLPGPHAYQLYEICAAGTFGTVCVVRDLYRGSLVALKVLKETHLHRPRVIARTHDEASILAQIHHPGIVQVEGLVELEGRPVVRMEWVRGLSLEAILRSKRDGLPAPEAIEVIRGCALALGAAYNAVPDGASAPMRVIHRDVKPSNVLMSVHGEVKVVDFGIARGEFEGKEAKTLSMVLGARGYLAPERLDGDADKPSCDIYSLGVMMYELLSGRHVVLSVHREYHTEALNKNLALLKPPGLSPAATEAVRRAIASMCKYDEFDRPNHQQVADDLEQIQQQFGLAPDLQGWAARELVPLFKNRSRIRPIDHPSYPDLAFVERQSSTVRNPAAPDVDNHIRAFLKRADWEQRLDELELTLLENPHWSEAPFLELLPNGSRSWWQFWGAGDLPSDKVIAILRLLRQRPTAAVRERAQQLRRHTDPRVAQAADQIFTA